MMNQAPPAAPPQGGANMQALMQALMQNPQLMQQLQQQQGGQTMGGPNLGGMPSVPDLQKKMGQGGEPMPPFGLPANDPRNIPLLQMPIGAGGMGQPGMRPY